LCKKWKFPKAVSKAIRYHHTLIPKQDDGLAIILHAADKLARMDGNSNGAGSLTHPIDDKVLAFLALDEDALSSIMFEVNESVRQITNEIFGTA
jgi:HD-like signal output (HDOD) protein